MPKRSLRGAHAAPSAQRASKSQAPVPPVLRHFTPGLVLGVSPGAQSPSSFDAQVGHAAMVVSYVHWGTPVSQLARLIAGDAGHRAETILELEPGPLGKTASQISADIGGSDGWLRQLGQTIRQLGAPVAISFFPEMNGPWHASWTNGPSSYVRAYQHVHRVLGRQATGRITWFWQPSAIHKDTPNPMPWWPGGGYVDVAAMDGYYYYPHDTFKSVFGQTIRLIRHAAPTVRLMVGETAAGPLFNRQVLEINNLFAGIRRNHVIGLVWFDQFQNFAPYQFHQDWRLQDHPAALTAFRRCLVRYGPLARLKRS